MKKAHHVVTPRKCSFPGLVSVIAAVSELGTGRKETMCLVCVRKWAAADEEEKRGCVRYLFNEAITIGWFQRNSFPHVTKLVCRTSSSLRGRWAGA